MPYAYSTAGMLPQERPLNTWLHSHTSWPHVLLMCWLAREFERWLEGKTPDWVETCWQIWGVPLNGFKHTHISTFWGAINIFLFFPANPCAHVFVSSYYCCSRLWSWLQCTQLCLMWSRRKPLTLTWSWARISRPHFSFEITKAKQWSSRFTPSYIRTLLR